MFKNDISTKYTYECTMKIILWLKRGIAVVYLKIIYSVFYFILYIIYIIVYSFWVIYVNLYCNFSIKAKR